VDAVYPTVSVNMTAARRRVAATSGKALGRIKNPDRRPADPRSLREAGSDPGEFPDAAHCEGGSGLPHFWQKR
jgi:hypothetical protein